MCNQLSQILNLEFFRREYLREIFETLLDGNLHGALVVHTSLGNLHPFSRLQESFKKHIKSDIFLL